ncbi:hypothetical protein DPEC_G00267460 [Dallia pectoralis]|uniref:Uncharacterized protein n=1 Tax=Dallia pectoralis TaxID=75939 RepID=A0ACC2FNV3_DALPE|nr:hypothetical protein DPEC_G00267460 [Dallia pectoralis]
MDLANTMEEFLNLETRLQEQPEFKKRLTHHLSLIGGANPGDCARRLMRSIATSHVWKHFSLHGKRGKKTFHNTTVYFVIKRAIMVCHAGSGEKFVEDLITNVLKHAPAHSKLQTKVLPDMTGRNAPHQPSGTVSWVGPPNQTQMVSLQK